MIDPCRWTFQYFQERYPAYFDGPNVIVEFGSYDVNGSIRQFFKHWRTYTGIDWRAGPGVDVVCLAKDAPLVPESVDVAVSSSMLEHDPQWAESLDAMVRCLKPIGILMLTWGGAHNRPHLRRSAIDRQFHPLPAGKVFRHVQAVGLYVHEFLYDRDVPGRPKPRDRRERHFLIEEVNLVAFKDRRQAPGRRRIRRMLAEDQV